MNSIKAQDPKLQYIFDTHNWKVLTTKDGGGYGFNRIDDNYKCINCGTLILVNRTYLNNAISAFVYEIKSCGQVIMEEVME